MSRAQPAQCVDPLPLPGELCGEDVEQDVDGLEDPRVREAVAHEAAVPARDEDALLAENGQVLRRVALRRADGARELADGEAASAAQLDEDQQTLGVGQRLAELGMEPEDLLAG